MPMATRNKAKPKVELVVTAEGARERALVPPLKKLLARAVAHLPANGLEDVVVSLVGGETMGVLHGRSHGDPTPTDVLTYELEHTAGGDVSEGQVVVCVDVARRGAEERSISVGREVLLYSLHGLLHLCGMDDRRKKDFDLMHKTEDDILTAIGVGPTFHVLAKAGVKKRAARAATGRRLRR